MVASFLAHSFIENPSNFTRQNLDNLIIIGNDHYTKIRATIEQEHQYLAPDQVTGKILAFNSAEVLLELNNSFQAITLNGYANKARGSDLPRLKEQLLNFMSRGFKYGILTIGSYSMGIYVDTEFTYYFDSHARGQRGGKVRSGEGTAIILKISNDIAPKKISQLANLNCISSDIPPTDINRLCFTLVACNLSNGSNGSGTETDDDLENIELQNDNRLDKSCNSPPRKVPKRGIILESDNEISSDDEVVHNLPSELPNFGTIMQMDCVIQRDDIIEPELDEILNKRHDLNRENRPPINENIENNLDLLAFPSLFPYGTNGLKTNRKIQITPLDYFQARLMCSENRFAGNTDFLFYGLSEVDKHRAKEKIAVCCAQKKESSNAIGENEDNLGVRDPHVYMSSIRGTSSYWKKYSGDVIAMIKTLGRPTFFFTFSYNDLGSHDCINALWKAKYGKDAEEVDPKNIPFEERKQLLNDYPIIAARHFSMRLSKFIALLKSNGTDIFGLPLIDYSIRVEFQARGSPHAHCLFWLQDASDWNTDAGKAFLARNVSCSLNNDFSDLVKSVQRHSHTRTCFKKQNVCRFAFPRPVSEDTRILGEDEITRNKGRFFILKREPGEEMIGFYHPILLQILESNQDIQPVTCDMGVAYYIAKYMSKAEPLEIRQGIRESINSIKSSSLPANKKMFKIAMTIMRNREVSAQEASFRICHLFLRHSSRSTVFIPTYKKEARMRMLRKESIAEGVPKFCTNIIDRYMARPRCMEQICLFEFAAMYAPKYNKRGNDDEDLIEFPEQPSEEEEGNNTIYKCVNSSGEEIGKIFLRRKAAAVKHPNFHPIEDKEAYHYSLLLLYLPFREENFCDTETPTNIFSLKYDQLRNHNHNPLINLGLVSEIDRALLRITEFSDDDNAEMGIDGFEHSFERNELLDDAPSNNEIFRPHAPLQNVTEIIKSMFSNCNSEQKKLFLSVRNAVQLKKNNFRKVILAEGGTGKSYVLNLISLLIRNTLSQDALIIAAPTGKSAFPIGGITAHKAFGLPIQHGFIKSYNKLSAKRLGDFRNKYRNVEWIILDEVSMISYQNFKYIHLRLCEIFGTDGTEPFAGKNVILFGDLMQIPPVKAARIFKPPAEFSCEVNLWREFEFSELTINMRQGESILGKICSELRVGKLTLESLKILKSRLLYHNDEMKDKLPLFDDAVRIFPQNDQCDIFNKQKTRELRSTQQTFKIKAIDTYGEGVKLGQTCPDNLIPSKDDLTAGIPTVLEIAVGSRVMLRRNKDTLKGYVNGATGVIQKIEWGVDVRRQISEGDLPQRVLIKFDHEEVGTWIGLETVGFFGKRETLICRRMLPLILCWAITVHKLQGATLSSAVIYLGPKCKTKGLAYVALSRVKTLEGLAICDLDPKKLLTTSTFCPADLEALAEIERLRNTVVQIEEGELVREQSLEFEISLVCPSINNMRIS